MGQVNTMFIWMTLLLIVLEFAGIGYVTNTALARELGLTEGAINATKTGITDISSDVNGVGIPLFVYIFGTILAVGLTASIVVGYITKSSAENYAVLPFIVTISLMFLDVAAGLIKQMPNFEGWISAIILIIFLPLAVSFAKNMIDWFRGTVT